MLVPGVTSWRIWPSALTIAEPAGLDIALALEGPGCEPIPQGVPIDREGIDAIVAMFAFTQPSRHLTDT